MTSEDIKKGDIVRLKSGGPKMTVVGIGKYGYYTEEIGAKCQWFTGAKTDELKEGVFELEAIVKVKPS